MTGKPSGLAPISLVTGAVAFIAMAIAAPGYRYGWWGLGLVFGVLFRVAAYGGLAAALLGVMVVAGSRFRPSAGLLVALAGLVLGAVAATPPLAMRYQAAQVPAIHDITTSVVDPPEFVSILPLRADAPNPPGYDPAIADLQRSAYPDIVTIRLREPLDQVFEAAEQIVGDLGWEVAAVDRAEGRIEATESTYWFDFKDDVVIRVRAAGGVTEVDVRSKSRVGRSDLGVNAERIRRFRNALLGRLSNGE